MRRSLLLVALLLAAPATQAVFYDPLPLRSASVTAIAGAGDVAFAGHDTGHVLAIDLQSGKNLWSHRNALSPVLAVEATSSALLLVHEHPDPELVLLKPDGSHQWNVTLDGSPTAAALGDKVIVGFEDGRLRAFHGDGTIAWTFGGPSPITGVAVSGGRVLVSTQDDLLVRAEDDGALLATTLAGARNVAIDGTDLFTIQGDTVHAWDAALHHQASFTFDLQPTAMAAEAGTVVVGDSGGQIHRLGRDLTHQSSVGTFANAVRDIHGTERVLAAFASGWVGDMPTPDTPVVLMYQPQPFQAIGRLPTVSIAFADGDASGALSYGLDVRVLGSTPSPWQTLSTGSAPASALSSLREIRPDMAAFPDGARVQLRVEVTDEDGHTGTDVLLPSALLDKSPPVPVGEYSPPDGAVLTEARPTIGIGFHDAGSGADEATSWVRIKGHTVTSTWTGSAIQARPTEPLPDGPHEWSATISDRAGNTWSTTARFTVDATAPVIEALAISAIGSDFAILEVTTNEPTQCGIGARSDAFATQHGIVAGDLEASTAQILTVTCADFAGSTTRQSVEITTAASGEATLGPSLSLSTVPAQPGPEGWFTQAPRIEYELDPDLADLRCRLDGGIFRADVPIISAGHHRVDCIATQDGYASQVQTVAVAYDETPPLLSMVAWAGDGGLLTWMPAEDAESGVQGYVVHARIQGQWQPGAPLDNSTGSFVDVPAGTDGLRLEAFNKAGLSATSEILPVSGAAGRVRTTAHPTQGTYTTGEDVAIQVRLGHGDLFRTAMLRDAVGVDHPFSNVATRDGPTLLVTAPTHAFPAGDLQAFIQYTGDGFLQTQPIGNITIVDAALAEEDATTDETIVGRDSPAMAPWLALALVFILRRR